MMQKQKDIGKVVLAVLIGATVGLGLFIWVSPLLGGQCLVICEPFRAVAAGAVIGGLLTLVRIRSSRGKRKLLKQEGGAKILRRKKQKRALWVGAIVFCMMAIFPPWSITTLSRDGHTVLTSATRYRFIWDAPSVDESVEGTSVDGGRLLIGWAVVTVLTGVTVIGAELAAKKDEKSQ